MSAETQIVLAIEAGIGGGSVSILEYDREVAHWIGRAVVSRAEELLVKVDDLLRSNKIPRDKIGLVAVSAGPGSFTGIRIGIATALGLKTGLGIEVSSISALHAMASISELSGSIIAVLPVGRGSSCWQRFEKDADAIVPADEPQTVVDDELPGLLRSRTSDHFLLHGDIYRDLAPSPSNINFGSNLAYAIGRACANHPGILSSPLFVSKSS
jgi:tRNA threonylcarbamoyl adenosine modification protein YeaZ